MVLVSKKGSPLSLRRAVLLAGSWGLGASLGVALGAWLTVVGEAGAPGVEGLQLGTDLFLLPVLAFVSVFTVHVVAQIATAWVRGKRRRPLT